MKGVEVSFWFEVFEGVDWVRDWNGWLWWVELWWGLIGGLWGLGIGGRFDGIYDWGDEEREFGVDWVDEVFERD